LNNCLIKTSKCFENIENFPKEFLWISNLNSIGVGNFKYSKFENGNFDTNLISKISRLLISKTSESKFKFIIKIVNFEKVVRNYKDILSTEPSHEYKSQNRSAKSSSQQIGKIWLVVTWPNLTWPSPSLALPGALIPFPSLIC
jgi:hypothetical protein